MKYTKRSVWFFLLFISGFLFPLTKASAQLTAIEPRPIGDSTYAKWGLLLSYQRFQKEEMNNVYDGIFGIHIGRTQWLWEMFGLRLTGGVVGGEGVPILQDTSWQFNSGDVGFWAINLQASVVARFTGGNPHETITPFLGIGVEGYGGIEKLSVSLIRVDTSVRGDASALVGLAGGHAMAGVYIPLTANNAMQVEVKYLYTIDGSYKDILSQENKAEFQRKIYSVVKRPMFNFSGIGASLMFFF
ncbi:MAG: hypothetical protein HY960_10015 [Ignavibacteriae bacterium]|nr:hypothetical protein [Ignavibacteriota bacterium]